MSFNDKIKAIDNKIELNKLIQFRPAQLMLMNTNF